MSEGVYLNSKSKSWYVLYDGPRKPNGARNQVKKAGFKTEQAAVKYRRKALADVDAGLFVSRGAGTVGDFLTQHFLANQEHLRHSTLRTYELWIRLHVLPVLGSMLLADVRPVHLQGLYSGLSKKGLAPLSVRHVHAILRVAFRRATEWGLLPVSPVRGLSLPSVPKRELLTWSPEQARTFLSALDGHRDAALYTLALTTGLRRGELLGLRWVDVQWQESALRVVQSIVESGGTVEVCAPKTRRSERTIAVDPYTVDVLRAHRARQVAERLAWGPGYVDNGLVFTRQDGTAYRPSAVSSRFETLQRHLELPRLRLHDIRHTHATLALEAGVPLTVVSERLGHSTITLTADTYGHVRPAVAREAADKIASVLFG